MNSAIWHSLWSSLGHSVSRSVGENPDLTANHLFNKPPPVRFQKELHHEDILLLFIAKPLKSQCANSTALVHKLSQGLSILHGKEKKKQLCHSFVWYLQSEGDSLVVPTTLI